MKAALYHAGFTKYANPTKKWLDERHRHGQYSLSKLYHTSISHFLFGYRLFASSIGCRQASVTFFTHLPKFVLKFVLCRSAICDTFLYAEIDRGLHSGNWESWKEGKLLNCILYFVHQDVTHQENHYRWFYNP